ncbi:ferrous iron transport protein A [Sporolactobacillus sp. CPB3-1]|uniref:Ferrous iron transport protein A n=1 Tax=Sporolactobacillus mangiferae TaxID=2940498 RepID=A0ABT0MDK8_9BACL|nr:FeoA family protein [Sporolactobacillus mangiferae]MCL1632960.1 ferrous iron transport protein A [Sporolactobacillus mangiferae]
MENKMSIAETAFNCRPQVVKKNCQHAVPLSLIRRGEKVHVACVCGKDETRRLLGNLGFVENAEVSVIAEADGNVIVKLKGTRIAISKAMARRVFTA